ncbi:hypothetical protein FRB94_011461 [Tulasnella sp. JGI-2019a]|nr:hypothetical protein FRB94_011461 [Tulasnella sp. JGI-2019a]
MRLGPLVGTIGLVAFASSPMMGAPVRLLATISTDLLLSKRAKITEIVEVAPAAEEAERLFRESVTRLSGKVAGHDSAILTSHAHDTASHAPPAALKQPPQIPPRTPKVPAAKLDVKGSKRLRPVSSPNVQPVDLSKGAARKGQEMQMKAGNDGVATEGTRDIQMAHSAEHPDPAAPLLDQTTLAADTPAPVDPLPTGDQHPDTHQASLWQKIKNKFKPNTKNANKGDTPEGTKDIPVGHSTEPDPGSVAAAPHNVVEQNHQVPDQLYADVAGGPPPIPPRTDYVPSLKKAEVNPNSAHPLTPAPVGGHQDQAVSLSKDIHHGNAPPASLGEVPSQHGVPPGTTHQTPVISAETEASHDAALIEKGGKKTKTKWLPVIGAGAVGTLLGGGVGFGAAQIYGPIVPAQAQVGGGSIEEAR